MTRTVPARFALIPPARLVPCMPIQAGLTDPPYGEADLQLNHNWLLANWRSPAFAQIFSTSPGYLEESAAGAGVYVMRAGWRLACPQLPLRQLTVKVYANTGGAGQTGTIKLTTASGSSQTAAVVYDAAPWILYTLAFVVDSGNRDSIRLWLGNLGAPGDKLRVKSISAQWSPFGAAALSATRTGDGSVPLDTEVGANTSLATWMRTEESAMPARLLPTRPASLIGYSDDFALRGTSPALLSDTSTRYITVAQFPFHSTHGMTHVTWSALGYTTGGGTAHLGLISDRMIAEGTVKITATLPAVGTLAEPYEAQWVDDGGSTLSLYPNNYNTITVYLRGDGANESALLALSMQESVT